MSEGSNEQRSISLLESNSEDIRSGKIEHKKSRSAGCVTPKKKKRTIYIMAVLAVSILLACVLIPSVIYTINEMLVYELSINETDITDYEDGIYTGTYTSAHMSATVSVTVVSGKMTAISLDSFTGIDTSRANEIFARVVYYQMLNIPSADSADVFSEATDYIVLKAIETALSGSSGSGLLV